MSCVDLLSRLLKHVLLVQPYNPGLNEAKKKKNKKQKKKNLIIFLGNASRHVSMLQIILIEKKGEEQGKPCH